jgi:hypothetical protein
MTAKQAATGNQREPSGLPSKEKDMTEKTIISSCADYREYEKALKARRWWSRANDYEVFNFALCLECRHFRIDPSFPTQGNCELIKQEGAYPGVMAQAVCSRFLSRNGTDINGRVVEPALFPAWVKTRKTKAGEVYIVQ